MVRICDDVTVCDVLEVLRCLRRAEDAAQQARSLPRTSPCSLEECSDAMCVFVIRKMALPRKRLWKNKKQKVLPANSRGEVDDDGDQARTTLPSAARFGERKERI